LAPLCVKYSCNGAANAGPLTIDQAGHLFGTLNAGGRRDRGSVFEVLKFPGHKRWSIRTLYSFCARLDCKDGADPTQAGVVADTAGNLYGTTYAGGAYDAGVFFKLSQQGSNRNWVLTVLYDFCSRNSACTDGGLPQGPLVHEGQAQGAAYDGVSPLYGTATAFGSHQGGTVFSLMPGTGTRWRETVLFSFCGDHAYPDCPDGKFPVGLGLDGQGNLIGVTAFGGQGATRDAGILFKLTPVSGEARWTGTVLHRFCPLAGCADGFQPIGAPVADAGGNIYGVTIAGGNAMCNGAGCGVLYKVTPQGHESVLYTFCSVGNCLDNSLPIGGPVIDANGVLYGTTARGGAWHTDVNSQGGGTVYSFSGSSLTTLYSFCKESSCTDGEYPVSGPTIDGAGNLYGPTQLGGPAGSGVVFQLQPR